MDQSIPDQSEIAKLDWETDRLESFFVRNSLESSIKNLQQHARLTKKVWLYFM